MMVTRPIHLNAFEFVLVSALRAHQLRAGSVARLSGQHNATTMAQMEVAEGHITRANVLALAPPPQCGWQL
jgi:DNA-directed RNA polymerase subunit K/omega